MEQTGFWAISTDPDTGHLRLTDANGLYMEREQAEELFASYADFLDHYGDTAIIRHNERVRRRGADSEPAPRTPRPGYVYVIEAEGHGLYKIGVTINPKSRLRSYSTIPFATKLLRLIPSDDARALERHYHKLFASRRGMGEWFRLTADDLTQIT